MLKFISRAGYIAKEKLLFIDIYKVDETTVNSDQRVGNIYCKLNDDLKIDNLKDLRISLELTESLNFNDFESIYEWLKQQKDHNLAQKQK